MPIINLMNLFINLLRALPVSGRERKTYSKELHHIHVQDIDSLKPYKAKEPASLAADQLHQAAIQSGLSLSVANFEILSLNLLIGSKEISSVSCTLFRQICNIFTARYPDIQLHKVPRIEWGCPCRCFLHRPPTSTPTSTPRLIFRTRTPYTPRSR